MYDFEWNGEMKSLCDKYVDKFGMYPDKYEELDGWCGDTDEEIMSNIKKCLKLGKEMPDVVN